MFVAPLTGRTHQIRAHMAHLGCPIVRDSKYQGAKAKRSALRQCEGAWCPRLFLHSAIVAFRDLRGVDVAATSPLPQELEAALACLVKCASSE
jgi:23S rRNA pseudouridine955/2504/2580 synthase